MKKLTFLFAWLCFASTLNLSAQGRNGGWDKEYEALLSDAEKVKLKSGTQVFKEYKVDRPDFKAEGIVRVIPTSQNGEYTFVEIGNWKKEFEFKRSNSDKGDAKVELVLDSLGNIISSKAFEKQSGQSKYFLIEELTLQKEVIDSKVFTFHLVKSYYSTGELWIEGYQRILDFDIPKSYMDKKIVPAKYERKYDKNGKLKKEKIFS